MSRTSNAVANERYEEGQQVVIDEQTASISLLQRRLRIGFISTVMIIDRLEEEGVVGPYNGPLPREVLVKKKGMITNLSYLKCPQC